MHGEDLGEHIASDIGHHLFPHQRDKQITRVGANSERNDHTQQNEIALVEQLLVAFADTLIDQMA